MGKIVITEFITLDGVVEDPGGAEGFERGGWAFQFDRGDAGNTFKYDELMAADVQLLGRVTYDGFAKAWPSMAEDDFGRKMNGMPKVVVSSTLTDPEWQNTTVVPPERLEAEVRQLKESVDGDVLVAGSVTLAQSLLALGLVDELRLMVHPVALGAGKRLFADGADRTDFTVAETIPAADCTILVLRPKGEA